MAQKYLSIGLFAVLVFVLATGLAFGQTRAPTPSPTAAPVSTETTVKASVGKYFFSAYGFASPFASVVMRTQSYFLGSTVADARGYFSIKDVFVNEGFSQFCFETIDVKKIGDSYTCLTIPPLTSDGEKRGIFLPPTLGLSGKSIRPGSSVFALGYSMPGSKIKLDLEKNIFLNTVADSSGLYEVEIKNLPVGKYLLFAGAEYEKQASEKPLRGKELKSLSLLEVFIQNLPKIIFIVLLVLLIIILLIILISKRARRRIREFLMDRGLIKRKTEKKTLHHEWLLGF